MKMFSSEYFVLEWGVMFRTEHA